MSTPRHHRARVASLTRHRGTEDPEVLDAQRALRAASLEEHIRRVVDTAPALTADQIDRLRALLPPVRDPATGSSA